MNTHFLDQIVASATAEPDAPLARSVIGSHMVGILGRRAGIASRVDHHAPGGAAALAPLPDALPGTLHAMAAHLATPQTDLPHPQYRSLALAAVNALLPVPQASSQRKGQDLIREHGRGRRVAVVGHFPFVERMAQEDGLFAAFSVLELSPRPGDLPATAAPTVLPQADCVAITGTTLLNGTLPELLSHCRPDAYILLLGPSTPFSSVLFDMGVSAIAGAVVEKTEDAFRGIEAGSPFKRLGGVRGLVWEKSQEK